MSLIRGGNPLVLLLTVMRLLALATTDAAQPEAQRGRRRRAGNAPPTVEVCAQEDQATVKRAGIGAVSAEAAWEADCGRAAAAAAWKESWPASARGEIRLRKEADMKMFLYLCWSCPGLGLVVLPPRSPRALSLQPDRRRSWRRRPGDPRPRSRRCLPGSWRSAPPRQRRRWLRAWIRCWNRRASSLSITPASPSTGDLRGCACL